MSPTHPAWAAWTGALGPLEGADVVDLGCADGDVARWCTGRGAASVLALDLDVDRLDAARGHPRGGRAIHYEQADLEQATLPFEHYDLACSTVVHRLEDPLRFARMTRAGLRPGAALVVLLPTGYDETAAALERGGLAPGRVTAVTGGSVLVLRKPARRR